MAPRCWTTYRPRWRRCSRAGSTCSQADERTLLQRAAVIGREFTHRALVELSPAEAAATLSGHLFELVRKGLVRPARPPGGEEAFRFHHVLVRDVAYNGLPKADRARLHERYADLLDGEPNAPDEIVGYHLEQAYRYRAELGPPNRRARQLAADAGARLGAAGMRAFRDRRHARDDQSPRARDGAAARVPTSLRRAHARATSV